MDRVVVSGDAAQGELVDVGGVPAIVTALRTDGVEVAPLAPVHAQLDRRLATALDPRRPVALARRGPLVIPAGDDLVGRAIDGLGTPIDDGPPVARDVVSPVFARDPVIVEPSPRRFTLGTLVFDLQHHYGLGVGLLVRGPREIVHHLVRHQSAQGRVVVIAGPVRSWHARGLPCIVVSARGESPGAAHWLAPWSALAIADAMRARGRDVVVVIDDLDAWQPHVAQFPERGSWPTQLAQVASRSYALRGSGSVSVLACTTALTIDHVSAFDRVVDLDHVLRGDLPIKHSRIVRPPIRVPEMGRLGGAVMASARLRELEELVDISRELVDDGNEHQLQLGVKVRECLRFRPDMPIDSVVQVLCLYAVVSTREVMAPHVADFVDAYVSALDREHVATLAAIRKAGRMSEAHQHDLLGLAVAIAARLR